MGRMSGEQGRRKKLISTMPALLTKNCIRRCVAAGLLPTTIYRASGPTPEFTGGFYKDVEDKSRLRKRYDEWVAAGKPTPRPPTRKVAAKLDRGRRRRARAAELRLLQDDICYLCGSEFGESFHQKATLDHVRPVAKGGRRSRNLLLAHSACNQFKADRPPRACELLFLAIINDRRNTP